MTGSDCGLVHLTTDGGKNWKNITPMGLPECMINSIELSPHDREPPISVQHGISSMIMDLYLQNDRLWKSWIKIAEGIQADDFIRVIREDKKIKGLLYGGTERGFYISYNGGMNWLRMQLNLPVVQSPIWPSEITIW